jgi:hypothetical protein
MPLEEEDRAGVWQLVRRLLPWGMIPKDASARAIRLSAFCQTDDRPVACVTFVYNIVVQMQRSTPHVALALALIRPKGSSYFIRRGVRIYLGER